MTPEQQAEVARIRDETLVQVGEEYDKLDANGDGNVDREELIAVARSQGQGRNVPEADLDSFFENFDANGDGKVSKQEWLDFFGRMFDEQMAPLIAALSE